MTNLDLTRKAMEEELLEKQFLYRSKYGGETVGVIKGIRSTMEMGFDRVTEERLSYGLSKLSEKFEDLPRPEKPTEPYTRWIANKVRFNIVSENGNSYRLDEIFIISKYEENVT